MYLKQRKASTDPTLRSLLQKSVRRGSVGLVDTTAKCLLALGDRTWLRSRTVVITFEEVWPLAQTLQIAREPETLIASLCRATKSTKQKDAAGLGALAFALYEGDRSTLDLVPSRRDLRFVAEAVSRPQAFFNWAQSECKSEGEAAVVRNAQQYLPAATWGWDKATILAGAYLAISSGVPTLPTSDVAVTGSAEFPYWAALDKHTPEGKVALHRVCAKLDERYRQLIWAGFYYESAVVNSLFPSPWFEAERNWRLQKAGLSPETAKALWERVRPLLELELAASVAGLVERLERKVQVDKGTRVMQARFE